MSKFDLVRAIFRITKCVVFVITLLNVYECQCRRIYSMSGQTALLNFPFPCGSTKITLQHENRLPFYRSTEGFVLLSLPENQANRFKVQVSIHNVYCSLDLTISNVGSIDEGTYLCTVKIDGQLRYDLSTQIGLRVEVPSDKVSCVKVQDKGEDWIVIDCTADNGNLVGKIECYQNGQKMPPVTDHFSMTENFLIRKSEPAFCCTLNEYKEICECSYAPLNLDDGESNDPYLPSPITTTRPITSTVTENNQADSCTGECKCNDNEVFFLLLVPLEVLLLSWSLYFCYQQTVMDPPPQVT